MRFLQLAKMTESPSDLVAVAFPIITVVLRGPELWQCLYPHWVSLRYIQSCVSLLHYSGTKIVFFAGKMQGKPFDLQVDTRMSGDWDCIFAVVL